MDDNATHDYDSAQIAESYSPAMAQTGVTYKVEVKGVGGWLLFFVLSPVT